MGGGDATIDSIQIVPRIYYEEQVMELIKECLNTQLKQVNVCASDAKAVLAITIKNEPYDFDSFKISKLLCNLKEFGYIVSGIFPFKDDITIWLNYTDDMDRCLRQ